MVTKFRNPNRNNSRETAPYVPEYRRLKIKPVMVDEYGRALPEDYEDPTPSTRGGMPSNNLPLSGGTHEANYQVDGLDIEDDQMYEEPSPQPRRAERPPRQPGSKPSQAGEIAPGQFIVLVKGRVVVSGDENKVKQAVAHLINDQSLTVEDIVVLRRMELNYGITIE